MNAHDIQSETERAIVRIERLVSHVGYVRRQIGNYAPGVRDQNPNKQTLQPVPSDETFVGRMEARLATLHNYIADVEAELEGVKSFIPDEKGPSAPAMRAA